MFQHSEFNSIPEFRGRLAWGSTLGCQETSKVKVPLLLIHQRCRISLFFEFSILGERFHPGALWNHFQFFDFLGYFITKSERRGKVWNISSSCARCTILFGIVSLLQPRRDPSKSLRWEAARNSRLPALQWTRAVVERLACPERPPALPSDWHYLSQGRCRLYTLRHLRWADVPQM